MRLSPYRIIPESRVSLFNPDIYKWWGKSRSPAESSQTPLPPCTKAQSLVRMLWGGGARALPLQGLPGGSASTAAEPALSMCRCVLCSSTENNHHGQEKKPEVAGRKREVTAGLGEASPVSFHPRDLFVCLNIPKQIFPRGISPRASAADNYSHSPFSTDLLLLRIKKKLKKKANKTFSLI